jgi:hypothetical protein
VGVRVARREAEQVPVRRRGAQVLERNDPKMDGRSVALGVGDLDRTASIGPAAAVLILGAHGVAATAAAGVLLAVTGITGSVCYAAWAITDRIVAGLCVTPEVIAARSAVALRSN